MRENNKKDATIFGLVVATTILAVLFLIALGMVLHMTYMKNKKTVEGKRHILCRLNAIFLTKAPFCFNFC